MMDLTVCFFFLLGVVVDVGANCTSTVRPSAEHGTDPEKKILQSGSVQML